MGLKLYGQANGFGWKQGETVGAQIVSVPMTVALDKADQAFRTFMASLVVVFVVAFVVLNVALSVLIIRPIIRMARAADQVQHRKLRGPRVRREGARRDLRPRRLLQPSPPQPREGDASAGVASAGFSRTHRS